MDHRKDLESILNALLLNGSELQEADDDPIASVKLSHEQKRLLNHLFNQWNSLSEGQKKEVLATQIETKVLEFSKKNQKCLREVGCRTSHQRFNSTCQQLDLNL